MPCPYCTHPKHPAGVACPICSGAPVAATPRPTRAPTRPVAARPPPPPAAPPRAPVVTAWQGWSERDRAYHLDAARQLWGRRDVMSFTAQLAQMARLDLRNTRVLLIAEMDARAARLGKLDPVDEVNRSAIIRACIDELGFDPRAWPAAPRPAGGQHRAAPLSASDISPERPRDMSVDAGALPGVRPALGDGNLPPLRAGDWAGLGFRVATGSISESDAREFGALWMSMS